MIDKEKFVENILNLLSAGQSEKEINAYVHTLGFSEADTKALMAEAKKRENTPEKKLTKMIPGTMDDQLKNFDKRKSESKKEMFKQNMKEMAKILDRIKFDEKTE